LPRQKQFALDWVFQADGSTSFISGSLVSGTVRLKSATTKWTAPTTFFSTAQDSGFCFSAASTTGCQDFYVGNTRQHPSTLWANNGQGGIHDMGAMELGAVTEAPDKSNGVGYHQFYNSQDTPAIVGHTYGAVTQDGDHYALFRVTGIAEAVSVQIFLPLVVR
jgi:hypothetical protein